MDSKNNFIYIECRQYLLSRHILTKNIIHVFLSHCRFGKLASSFDQSNLMSFFIALMPVFKLFQNSIKLFISKFAINRNKSSNLCAILKKCRVVPCRIVILINIFFCCLNRSQTSYVIIGIKISEENNFMV